MRNPKRTRIAAGIAALMVAIAVEQYCERWWIVKTPSGNREFYHGLESYVTLLVLTAAVVAIVYRALVRVLSR